MYIIYKAIELQKEKGYTFVHPFDDLDVIAGQGTIGLEILNQIENIDAVVSNWWWWSYFWNNICDLQFKTKYKNIWSSSCKCTINA